MKQIEMETKLKKLEKTVKALKKETQAQADIESIKKLQRAYGYYLEHWQEDEIVELFSHNPEVSVLSQLRSDLLLHRHCQLGQLA
jgi:DNA-binding protein H-NS